MPASNWKQFIPFIFYTATVLVLVLSAAPGEERPFAGIAAWLVAGLLSWSLLEYLLHRFAFHHPFRRLTTASRRMLSASHQAHHDHPQATEGLFASLALSIPVALGYYLLAWLTSGDWRTAVYLFTGLVCGYFGYEWLHYRAHHGPVPRLRALKYLRKYHLLHHHHTPDLRFGVTSPAVDYLFGTFRRVGRGRQVSRGRENLQTKGSP